MIYYIYVKKCIKIVLPILVLTIGANQESQAQDSGDSLLITQPARDSAKTAPETYKPKKGVYDLRDLKLPLRGSMLNRSNSIASHGGRFGFQAQDEDAYQGLPLNKIEISGVFRFVTIYRNMEQSYADMLTSKKNISFFDYPFVDIGTSAGVGNPILALAMTARVKNNASFRIGYSISHSFTGSPDNTTNKIFSSFGGLSFEGNIRTTPVIYNLKFGGVLTMRTSRLIFDAPKYRGNYFDRVASNNYSVSKFEGMYSAEDTRVYLWPYVRGGIARFTMPGLNNLYVQAMYGRTGQTIYGGLTNVEFYPAVNYMVRVGTPYNFGRLRGNFALNYFARKTNTDTVYAIHDDVDVYSTDFDVKIGKYFKVTTELGTSYINNPLIVSPKWGGAFIAALEVDRSLLKFPLKIEYYDIGISYGNLDGEVLNSNTSLRSGGVNADPSRDQTLFVNVGQEVGQLANNRRGVSLTSDFKIGNFSAELGYAASGEKQNLYDSITFQHRVNAFSRSRFTQWRQGIGPYGRIRSVFARTYELVTITDSVTNYKKGFNTIDLLARYQFGIGKLKFVLINYSNFVSIQDHSAVLPVFSDDAFIRTWFEDFTFMCKLSPRLMVLANYGIERVWGNTRVTLSPDKAMEAPERRVIDQTGHAWGIGAGYDITNKTSIHIRHKWMDHTDKNFIQDVFKGQESTIELKMFL